LDPDELMRRLFATIFLVLTGFGPAAAEVCDKVVGEGWQPSHGPVWLLNPVGFPVGLTILLAGLVLVAAVRSRWLGYSASGLVVLVGATLIFVHLMPEHDIYLASIKEGCRSYLTDVIDVALLLSFACAYAWLGHRRSGSMGAPRTNEL
jgi:hypothetical protein